MRRFTSFLFGALIGGVIGGALATLLAPSSGQALRENIAGYYKKSVDEIQQAGKQRRDELELELQHLRS